MSPLTSSSGKNRAHTAPSKSAKSPHHRTPGEIPAGSREPEGTFHQRRGILAQHLVTGLLAALVLGLFDALYCAASEHGLRVTASETALAIFHLIALYLPPGWLLGLIVGSLWSSVRRDPLAQGFRNRLFNLHGWLTPQPRLIAALLSAGIAVAVLSLIGKETYSYLVRRTHRSDLAAYTMAGVIAASTLVCGWTFATIRQPITWLSHKLRPLSIPVLFVALIVIGGSIGAALFLRSQPQIIQAYGWARILWGPLALCVYLSMFVLSRKWFDRSGRPARARRISAVFATLGALILFVISGMSYGQHNRVRSVVEQRSVVGRSLIRRYARMTDWDGDHHASAFGGRDCDDFNPEVHPGALDREGDGIDADCFAGDGSPDVADLGDGRYGALPEGFPARPNFVFITIDALRPDHLGVNGYTRPTSPHLDQFAETAVNFRNVIAQSSRSLRAIPSFLTGHYPSQIAFGGQYLWPALLPQNISFAEVLRDQGYSTSAFIGTNYFHRLEGFFQGFEEVTESPTYKPNRRWVTDAAMQRLGQLATQEQPFLLWAHLFNVHAPYLRPPHASAFGPTQADHYDTEIQLADALVQEFIERIETLGLDDNTVVIIASDHGEAFGEHGEFGHSTTLYQEELCATLLIRAPGVAPRLVEDRVALFDLAPTFLNFANITFPDPTPARSLLPLMTTSDATQTDRLIFSELMPDGLFAFDIKAVQQGDDKLVWWVQDGHFQLFDLASDPNETQDRSDADRARALELLGLLQTWVANTNLPENRTEVFIAQNRLSEAPSELTHPLQLNIPGIAEVIGFDLPRTTFRPGETIPLAFYYHVTGETSEDLFFRVHLESTDGSPIPEHFHGWHFPLHSRYHTNAWRQGEYLRDPIPMVVPPEIAHPLQLRMSLAVQRRDEGLVMLESGGRPQTVIPLAQLEIR